MRAALIGGLALLCSCRRTIDFASRRSSHDRDYLDSILTPRRDGAVGPSARKMSKRAYIAGTLPNTPENLREWIQHPQRVKPKNAMPEVPMSDQDARDMTAYLYTLE